MEWIKRNLTLGIIITLLLGYGGGAAAYAVLTSDVDRLKKQVETMPDRLVRVETKIDILLERK